MDGTITIPRASLETFHQRSAQRNRPLDRIKPTSGGFSVVLKDLPGAMLGTHYHVCTVRGYTMRGYWRYLEHDWVAHFGTFIYEPAGEAHTLVITTDSPEPALIMFVVEGGLIYLDKRSTVALLPTRINSPFSS